MINGFNVASFTIYENGNFVLKSSNTSKLFMKTLNMQKKCQMEIRSKLTNDFTRKSRQSFFDYGNSCKRKRRQNLFSYK